ncbi:MAG: hypothetical protein ACPG5T_03545 [Endozoicomonas sp.]
MSSGIKIDPSSSAHLDYGENKESFSGHEESEAQRNARQKTYIDRGDHAQREKTHLKRRKTSKRLEKKKKKKLSERNTRESSEGHEKAP